MLRVAYQPLMTQPFSVEAFLEARGIVERALFKIYLFPPIILCILGSTGLSASYLHGYF